MNKNTLVAFLFGLGATITVRIIGIFAISDLIAIIFMPFIFNEIKLKENKRFFTIIKLLFLWMIFAFISDLLNFTESKNILKGFFSLVPFLACLFFSFWLLKKDPRLMKPFLWGYSISFLLSAGFGIDVFYQEMIERKGVTSIMSLDHYDKILNWVFGSFITGAVAMTYFKKWPKLITGLIFIFALFSLIQGSRSEFLLNFIISGLLFYILINTASIEEISPTWHQKFRNILPKFILLVFTMLFITANLYEYSVKNGYLSDDESYKYYMQKNTKIGLFSGRGELIASFLAIKDSPILGHGSFAKDSNAYGYKASVLIGDDFNSESYFLENRNENYIPTHSHLWQAWVYNGVFGAIFWLFILIGILGVFFKNYIFFYPIDLIE